MLFWKPVGLVLRLRFQAARADFARSPTPLLWTLLLAGVLGRVALYKGSEVAALWTLPPTSDAQAAMLRAWLTLQTFWLLTLLLPGVVSLSGHAPPPPSLRPFALRPSQLLAAETLAALADIPTLLALLWIFPLLLNLIGQGLWMQALIAASAMGALGIQTALLARGLKRLGGLSARRLRKWAEIPTLAALLLFGLCAGLPPAFASLTSAPVIHAQFVHVTLPQLPLANLAPLLPSALAAQAIISAQKGDYPALAGALSRLTLCVALTGGVALLALRGSLRVFADEGGYRSARQSRGPVSRQIAGCNAREAAHSTPLRVRPLEVVWAVAVTEWRLLLRAPQNYLRLCRPASALLLCVFGFLSPNMGRNPVYNLEEFLGIGAIFYNVLWQMQLLCNRFGAEAGTGALLFGFSAPRRTLLLGRNAALLGLLLCLDGPALAGLCVVAGYPQNIPLLLLWLPMTLLTLTALGNVVSVLCPFVISPAGRTAGAAPDALAGGYIAVGCLTALLLVPAGGLLSLPVVGGGVALGYTGMVYAVSLYGAGVLMAGREYRMIAALGV